MEKSGIPEIADDVLRPIVAAALREDMGAGDITSQLTIAADSRSSCVLAAREVGVLSGLSLARLAFLEADKTIQFTALKRDGDSLAKGDVIARITGSTRGILLGERIALNFLSHLSGIASLTQKFVREVQGTKTTVVDTRKTIPGLRLLQKYAVRCGGGGNHRFDLGDAILIKDNHVAAAGSVLKAVQLAVKGANGKRVEVEVDRFEQIDEALQGGAHIIMLDNFSLADMRRAVAHIGTKAKIEASGGVNLQTIRGIAETGVDIISVGQLTHSAAALDIGLDFEKSV